MFVSVLIVSPNKLRINFRDIWWFLCTGILCILLSSTLYFVSIPLTTSAIANVLMYTSPIWILIFSIIFFKEKISLPKIISLCLAVLGCTFATGIIASGNLKFSALGTITGILSGLFYGLYSIFGKFVLKKYDSVTVTLYTALFAGLGSIFIINIPQTMCHIVDTSSYIPILLIVALVTIAPYTLYTIGLKHCKATRASIISCVEPMTSAILGTFVLHEPFTVFQLMGIIMILCACFILQIKKDSI